MRKIERLKKEALESCKFRDHEMKRFINFGHTAISHCKLCDRSVAVDTHPLSNGIDIGGEAVALNCEGWPLMFGLANLRLAGNQ